MFRVAIYGKGGIGKSTISANVSYILSCRGYSVLHIGCDPKHDSTRLLIHGKTAKTFSSDVDSDPVFSGLNDIRCIECGGAEPGKGCAGKGMELLFSKISDVEADYRISDVLGDVVCGGFSIPARKSNADAVLIVTSGEFMSIYAANNILRGLENINPGESVLGLVFNRRGDAGEDTIVRRFSEAVGIPIVCDIPRSELFRKAEAEGEPLALLYPESNEASILQELCDLITSKATCYRPSALSEESMMDLAAGRPVTVRAPSKDKRKPCNFEGYDAERNLTYKGDFVMPACTSHGAADGAMRIRDAAVIMNGPRNCSYLMEYAFQRRVLNGMSERSGYPPRPGVYSTSLDAEEVFKDTGKSIEDAILEAKKDGYHHMFLIATCASEIVGTDISKIAKEMSDRHSVDVIPVSPDPTFLGSKFGGTFGLFDALISRMRPREISKGTVNLIGRWFYGFGKDRTMEVFQSILSKMGLEVRFCFLDFCTMSEIEDFCSAEYDIQLGRTQFNRRISERISDVTGRRMALELESPVGLGECLQWVRSIAEYAPELSERKESAERMLTEEYESVISRYRPLLEGKKVIIYCLMMRDLNWQIEALESLKMDVRAVMFANGAFIDHNAIIPEYEGINVMNDVGMCDLKRMTSVEKVDIVITNDAERVAREGFRWAPLGSRYFGIYGVECWAQAIYDSLRVPRAKWEDGL